MKKYRMCIERSITQVIEVEATDWHDARARAFDDEGLILEEVGQDEITIMEDSIKEITTDTEK